MFEIEDEFHLCRELVDVLPARSAAPRIPEADIGGRDGDTFRNDDSYAHGCIYFSDS